MKLVLISPEVAVPDRSDVSVVSSPADDYCSEESDDKRGIIRAIRNWD